MTALEIRVDPLSGAKSIVAAGRAQRPGGGFRVLPLEPIDKALDPFLEGHEDQTPPEIFALREGSEPNTPGWRVRVVPNLFPALKADPDTPALSATPDLFTAVPAAGSHEVIINTPQALQTLAELSLEQLQLAARVWAQRMRVQSGCAYVHMIVNERKEAGASLPHTHGQLYGLAFVPPAIARERERFAAYSNRNLGSNLLGDLLQEEVHLNERIIAIDDEAVLLAPYASRVPFQMMLVPRRVEARFEREEPLGIRLLYDGLQRLRAYFGGHPPPMNLWIRTAPQGADHFCWRIDIWPRLTHFAAMELGAEINICIVAPEEAATQLRTAL